LILIIFTFETQEFKFSQFLVLALSLKDVIGEDSMFKWEIKNPVRQLYCHGKLTLAKLYRVVFTSIHWHHKT
jgi:hypothetical protein